MPGRPIASARPDARCCARRRSCRRPAQATNRLQATRKGMALLYTRRSVPLVGMTYIVGPPLAGGLQAARGLGVGSAAISLSPLAPLALYTALMLLTRRLPSPVPTVAQATPARKNSSAPRPAAPSAIAITAISRLSDSNLFSA